MLIVLHCWVAADSNDFGLHYNLLQRDGAGLMTDQWSFDEGSQAADFLFCIKLNRLIPLTFARLCENASPSFLMTT